MRNFHGAVVDVFGYLAAIERTLYESRETKFESASNYAGTLNANCRLFKCIRYGWGCRRVRNVNISLGRRRRRSYDGYRLRYDRRTSRASAQKCRTRGTFISKRVTSA